MTSVPQPLPSGPQPPERVIEFYAGVAQIFNHKPFKAHPMFSSAHAQTLAAYAWPRRRRLGPTVSDDEERLFEVDEGVQISGRCRWQKNKLAHPTMVIWHGMEGSVDSVYMWSTAHKAFLTGFNVVRVNYRNCGGTEHLSPGLYHGGMSADLRAVLSELIQKDGLKRLFPIGFSLGGNMLLKLAGEYGETPPAEIIAACVVSPSVDLRASTNSILKRTNWIYHRNFVRSLKKRIRLKNWLYPDLYDVGQLDQIKTIRDFDERFTSLANGFANADDYYKQSSSVHVVDKIRIPTLIIHAVDDPFIPFEPLLEASFANNRYVFLVPTNQGGHVAFISKGYKSEDRFWAENRAIEFCQFADAQLVAHF